MRLMVQQTQLSKPAAKKVKGVKGVKQPYRNKETEDDDFGVDDGDWAVYSQINLKEDQGDDTELEERVAVIDTQLEEYEAQRAKENPETRDQILARMKGELQFELGLEQVQVPELVFQPAMMGVDQTGVGGAMEFVFPRFSEDEQLGLAEVGWQCCLFKYCC
jgi:actin-related protein 5